MKRFSKIDQVINSFVVVVVDTVGTNLILAVYASHAADSGVVSLSRHDCECNTGSTACCTSTIHAWNNAPMAQHTVRSSTRYLLRNFL